MRFSDSVIRLSEFFLSEGRAMNCVGQKIRSGPGEDLVGRDFRLGVNQLRAMQDPDNLLPGIRSGHVNIYDPYTGKIRGNFSIRVRRGGKTPRRERTVVLTLVIVLLIGDRSCQCRTPEWRGKR